MCNKTLFHPTAPCCGAGGLCLRFPSIDWNRIGWTPHHPGAEWAEVLYVPKSHGGPVVNFGAGDPDNGKYSYSGLVGSTGGVLFSWHGYHMPAGDFYSENVSPCQWLVACRERLCPWQYRLAICSAHPLNADSFVSDPSWKTYRGMADEFADPVSGPFEYYTHGGFGNKFFSWRSILKAAECSVLPELRSQGFDIIPQEDIEGGLLYRLENAKTLIDSPAAGLPYARPTAMDRAVAFTLSGGIRFGVEPDRRSPFYNQLVIFEGGQFASETVEDVTTRWLVSTPWKLVSGDPDLLKLGAVLKYQRTDNNDTLPPWLELELVRI